MSERSAQAAAILVAPSFDGVNSTRLPRTACPVPNELKRVLVLGSSRRIAAALASKF